ncbi:AraC family ligand binding domain-containing protein [Serratia ficaria]|uniref:AraC family ligand binding domain-containing protein n=1 Tax=Serratia ficaria TaxID=61651 RepID=UPI002178389B|nr:AraC family ligand binding domain-containing protein [Serratia ficaria]CAI1746276.1 AraC-like ligand binding domain [Serratia ficaria]
MKTAGGRDWVRLQRDDETGIESVHAHFRGHAYDPHDHDELLVGVTQQGLQRFNCHRALHTSRPGRAILIEPGAVHDGHAPEAEGFTYAMLYLPQAWVSDLMQRRGLGDISAIEAAFRNTLADDPLLSTAIQQAFFAVHHREGRLARDQGLDHLMTLLARHIHLRPASQRNDSLVQMNLVRDYLHERMADDIGLEALSRYSGIDRFRLSRQFKQHVRSSQCKHSGYRRKSYAIAAGIQTFDYRTCRKGFTVQIHARFGRAGGKIILGNARRRR